MNRIEQRFSALRGAGTPAFVPFITCGDPSPAATEEILLALERAGADVIELGVPFSDPVGDGAVIQEAYLRALAHGVSLRGVLDLVRRVRTRSQVPILLFSYYNPILHYGIADFARDAAAAGADGVLCVDLPPDDCAEYKQCLDAAGLCTVFLVAPTTPPERMAFIGEKSTGFVYYVSRLGVTGESASLADTLGEAVERVRRHVGKPVAVGFGISTPEQARTVALHGDAVVVGSAIVRLISQTGDTPELVPRVEAFAASLVQAVKTARQGSGSGV